MFFVAHVESNGVVGDFLLNAIHGLVVMQEKRGKSSLVDRLGHNAQDHNNACVQFCMAYLLLDLNFGMF